MMEFAAAKGWSPEQRKQVIAQLAASPPPPLRQ